MIKQAISITDYTNSLEATPYSTSSADRELIRAAQFIIINSGPDLVAMLKDQMWQSFVATVMSSNGTPIPSIDTAAVVVELLRSIAQEREAGVELGYSCMSIVADSGIDNKHDTKLMGRILMELGQHLFSEAKALGMYHKGYLNWRYHNRHGNDIILVKRRSDLDIC